MNDVSILLNLTGRVAFQQTDPLMDLVSGHGPYLFYDRLSLRRFPLAKEEQDRHVGKLLVKLRNLLENRRISADDKGGKIRLHLLLDLAGSFLHDPEQTYSFPAQKVRRFKEMLGEVFKQNKQMLQRISYTFFFIACDNDDQHAAEFYCGQAYYGYGGFPEEWLSSDSLSVNAMRDQWIDGLDAPSEDTLLKGMPEYVDFQQSLQRQVGVIASFLGKACVDFPFRQRVSERVSKLRTIGDVKNLDFNEMLGAEVSKLIGLRYASDEDSAFFIFKHQTGTENQRRSGEMVLTSLLQLVGTLSDKDYPTAMGLTPGLPPKLFVIDAQDNVSNLNAEALFQLKDYVSACLPKLKTEGSLRWSKNKAFPYREFSAKNTEPVESDDYKEQKEIIKKQRNELFAEFQRLRIVPFFFGDKPGDWRWFNDVSVLLDKIYAFESKYERPLFSSMRRITEKEMNIEGKENTYAVLETKRDEYEHAQSALNPLADMKDYLEERKESMAKFAQLKEEVKKEMVKLGFASTTFWISLLSGLFITLCYAFRFFYTGFAENPVWIGVGFGAVCLIIALAALVAWGYIKSSISSVFNRIHACLTVELQEKQETYLKSVNERISKQNAADIRKRNLDELNEKLQEYERHNMQVDLWKDHFQNMEEILSGMLTYVDQGNVPQTQNGLGIDDGELHIEFMPALPDIICQRFRKMKVTLSNEESFDDVTCFLKRMDVSINKNTIMI